MSHERQYIWKKNSRVICRKPNDIDVLMCKKKEIIMRMSLIWLTRSFESVPWLRYIDLDSYLLRQAQYIYFMTHFLIMEWGVKGGTCAWFFSHVTRIRRIHKRDVTSADVSFICGGAYDGSLLIYLNESRTIIICRKPSTSISYSSCWGYSLINTLKLKKKYHGTLSNEWVSQMRDMCIRIFFFYIFECVTSLKYVTSVVLCN